MKNEQLDPKPTQAAEAAPTAKPTTPSSPKKKTAGSKQRRAEAPAKRSGTKKATILRLVQRPNGATLKQLMKATGWQAHSVRGCLSGTLRKQMGAKIKILDRNGERAYHVKA